MQGRIQKKVLAIPDAVSYSFWRVKVRNPRSTKEVQVGSKKAADAPRSDLYMLGPHEIVLVTKPGERFYDRRVKRKLKPGLVESIAKFGVVVPIIVTKKDDKIICVAGRQRVRAALIAQKTVPNLRIPAVFRRGDELKTECVRILENELRSENDAVTRAEDMVGLHQIVGDWEEVGLVHGLSAQACKQYMKILDLSDKVKDAIREGTVAWTAALQLADLPEKEQVEKLEEIAKLGVAPTAGQIRKAKRKGKEGEEEQRRPGVKVMRYILGAVKNDEEDEIEIAEGEHVLLKYLMGEIGLATASKTVGWLKRVVNAMTVEEEARSEKLAARRKQHDKEEKARLKDLAKAAEKDSDDDLGEVEASGNGEEDESGNEEIEAGEEAGDDNEGEEAEA